jgi:hypothetical protein
MTKIMRLFALRHNKARNAPPREAIPHNLAMAAIGVTAPEFI